MSTRVPILVPMASSYHHGNLAEALVDAASDLARAGGPDAVALREVARRVGVSATAAYRHFGAKEDVLAEVASHAREQLAQTMLAELDALPARRNAARGALDRFRAAGRGYLRFARTEPGLFESAFLPFPPPRQEEPSAWDVLAGTLDGLCESGVLSRAHREGAEIVAWSAVHGLAELQRSGALLTAPVEEDSLVVEDRVLDSLPFALGARRS